MIDPGFVSFPHAFVLLISGIMLTACGVSKSTNKSPAEITEHILLDSLVITPETHSESLPSSKIQFTTTRSMDLLHTTLELSFDWNNQTIEGVATLTLTPFAYRVDTLTLHAKYFDIHAVSVNDTPKGMYFYDGAFLKIPLSDSIEPGQHITCVIVYTAHPHNAPARQQQGFFFIDPYDTIPDLPRHIWTIGETQYNSQWFPTIDQPNERHTQDLRITVDTQFVTLSNGSFVGSVMQPGGMRQDHWVMSQSHAPYLTVLVVGRYDVVRDQWKGIPVSYYVDKGYGASAKDIFAHTPEMLTFFSEILDYPYPWPKFDQAVVHNFTAGAMENTTAVTFADDVQKHHREFLVSGENDGIIAHEMFHQWFGDLLTCENWSQLALNEGFANYGEYLWKEHKYGKDDAQQVYLQELQGYLFAAEYGMRPLVEYHYDDPDALFDAHSYNKGCLVLHHLRRVLGDEVFFRGLRKYLQDNAFRAVEIHDLRLAMEDVSGIDLNAFFDQWYFTVGHPVISVSEYFNPELSELQIHLSQLQDPVLTREAFQFTLDLQVFFSDGASRVIPLDVRNREQMFSIPVLSQPVSLMYDPMGTLPWSFQSSERTPEQCRALMSHTNSWLTRRESVLFMADHLSEFSLNEIRYVLKDPHWVIRQYLLSSLTSVSELQDDLVHLITTDPDARVRLIACAKLGELSDVRYAPIFESFLTHESKVAEISTGLEQLAKCDLNSALLYASHFENDSALAVLSGVASVYALHADPVHRLFFRNAASEFGYQHGEFFFTRYATWISRLDSELIPDEISALRILALSPNADNFARYYATYAVWLLRSWFPPDSTLQVLSNTVLDEIIDNTTEPVLRNWYQNFN